MPTETDSHLPPGMTSQATRQNKPEPASGTATPDAVSRDCRTLEGVKYIVASSTDEERFISMCMANDRRRHVRRGLHGTARCHMGA